MDVRLLVQTPNTFDPGKRKLLSLLAHGSIFISATVVSILIPISIYFVADDPVVKDNAKESINFHFNVWFWGAIVGSIIAVLSFITFGLLGLILFPVVALGFALHWGLTGWAVLHCLNDPDQPFRYPFIFRPL
jgi:uncharacterized Tic20 family protein